MSFGFVTLYPAMGILPVKIDELLTGWKLMPRL